MNNSYTYLLLFIITLLSTSCSILKSPIPQPEREFRGFWVATVVNIDWPKNGADTIEKQKADYIELLDFYKELHFNTAIVQVRCAGDAFYESKYAPWSKYLTGTEGKSPKNNLDILHWMINQTHARGMEFHAWLNPYRATFNLKTEILAPTHDYNMHPNWMVKYGKKYYYNPGLPAVQEHMTAIIDELVSNYNIDAVHFDDYFYPYTISGEIFNDSIAYTEHKKENQKLADWRRSNIDSLIKKSYQTIKNKKPWVQFGVSPFGVWKNNSTDPLGSDTKAGQTTYDDLYADPLLWMQNGWLDYIIPQVYWSMNLPVASHTKIVDWWAKNTPNTNLYIGNGPYKINNNSDQAWFNKKELPNQILYGRNESKVLGNAFFSAKSLINNNKKVVSYLKRKYYKNEVLPPKMPVQNPITSNKVIYKSNSIKGNLLEINFNDLSNFKHALIYSTNKKKTNSKLITQFYIEDPNTISILNKKIKRSKETSVVFIDKYGNKSTPIVLPLKQTN